MTACAAITRRCATGSVEVEAPAHLLIVDDDERIRSLLTKFLRQNGFLVTVAQDAAQARQIGAAETINYKTEQLVERVVADRVRRRRIEAKRVGELAAKAAGQIPVLTLDVEHHDRVTPRQQRRHHQPHAFT